MLFWAIQDVNLLGQPVVQYDVHLFIVYVTDLMVFFIFVVLFFVGAVAYACVEILGIARDIMDVLEEVGYVPPEVRFPSFIIGL